jgi:hypothetical protein
MVSPLGDPGCRRGVELCADILLTAGFAQQFSQIGRNTRAPLLSKLNDLDFQPLVVT